MLVIRFDKRPERRDKFWHLCNHTRDPRIIANRGPVAIKLQTKDREIAKSTRPQIAPRYFAKAYLRAIKVNLTR